MRKYAAILLILTTTSCGTVDSLAQPTLWGPTPTSSAPPAAGHWGTDPTATAVEKLVRESFMLTPDEPFAMYTCRTTACWVPYINGFSFKNGILTVTVQVDRNTPQGKDIGADTARAVRNFITTDDNLTSKINWVVAADGAGTEIAQEPM